MLKAMTAAALAGCLVAPAALAQQRTDLSTRSGHDVGVTLTNYKYSEPGVMAIKARKIGFDYSITHAIGSEWPNRNNGWFVRADLRYATGKGDYSSNSSGTQNDLPDWYYEVRGLLGKDFDFGGYSLSPYAGLGYRYLFNDLRGTTSVGSQGYRRESRYTTLPIGVTHKINLANQKQLLTTLEYDFLVSGQADAKLSDSSLGRADLSFKQSSGYGLRFSTLVRFDTWSVGPSLVLWRIKDSETVSSFREPRNNTLEFGVKASYHF